LPETTRARQVLALSAREAGGVMEVSGVMGWFSRYPPKLPSGKRYNIAMENPL
jgi:hypothetical protein